MFWKYLLFSALCELFDKADTGGDGTISLEEYMVMCDEYGIELTEEHLKEVRSISNDNGEVKITMESRVWSTWLFWQVRKNDFICHIKNTGMFGLFDKTDPESDTHWQNIAITAFKWESVKYWRHSLIFIVDCLTRITMVTSTRRSSNGWRPPKLSAIKPSTLCLM